MSLYVTAWMTKLIGKWVFEVEPRQWGPQWQFLMTCAPNFEGEEDDKYNEEGEDYWYNEDGEDAKAALDLVTQVHSERMTTVGMGRVRVLVRNKTWIRKQQIVKKSLHVVFNCQNQAINIQFVLERQQFWMLALNNTTWSRTDRVTKIFLHSSSSPSICT